MRSPVMRHQHEAMFEGDFRGRRSVLQSFDLNQIKPGLSKVGIIFDCHNK